MKIHILLLICFIFFSFLTSQTLAFEYFNYDISSQNYVPETTLRVLFYFIFILVVIFCTIRTNIMKRNKSKIKGGIFYEDKKEEETKDKPLIRTHHVLTKNDYSIAGIQAIDDFFDETRFLLFAKNVFIKLQSAWSKFDLDTIKSLETNKLFEEHKEVLNRLQENKQVNVIEQVFVHSANIISFEQDTKKYYINVLINASMIEYLMNEETKEILQGDAEFKINVTYKMKFERKKGVKTQKDIEKKKKNIKVEGKKCPNCGAPLDKKLYGWCEYCMGVNKGRKSWILNKIEVFED